MSKKVYLFSATSHPDVINVNSLDFNFLKPVINFSKYDYLILTSKKAVDALQNYNIDDYIGIPALCISNSTKDYYEKLGGKVLEVGNGLGSDLNNIIVKYPKDTKWLYLRAKEIAGNDFNTDEAIVYESSCSNDILNFRVNAKEESSLIFTSPSSIRCFLKNNVIPKNAKVIVIGNTTAKKIPSGIEFLVAKTTSIQECIDLALE